MIFYSLAFAQKAHWQQCLLKFTMYRSFLKLILPLNFLILGVICRVDNLLNVVLLMSAKSGKKVYISINRGGC